MKSEQLASDELSRLRETAELYAASNYDFMSVKISTVLALIKCADIVQTDYLILSNDQRMGAFYALKELGL